MGAAPLSGTILHEPAGTYNQQAFFHCRKRVCPTGGNPVLVIPDQFQQEYVAGATAIALGITMFL